MSENIGGYSTVLFVNPPSDDSICGVCLDVLNDPHQCKNGHCFCLSCITFSLEGRTVCPTCSTFLTVDLLSKNLVLRNLIGQRIIKCKNSVDTTVTSTSTPQIDSTCHWTGPVDVLQTHLLSCSFQKCKCPLFVLKKCVGCSGEILKRFTSNHLLRNCQQDTAHIFKFLQSIITQFKNQIVSPRTYFGSYCGDKPHGYGTAKFSDHNIYTGEFHMGLPCGYGIETLRTDKSNWLYYGMYKEGNFHGIGTIIYDDDNNCDYSTYVGDWKNGLKCGQGKLSYSNGLSFTGAWDNDELNGFSDWTLESGGVFSGMCVNGKRNGHGVITFPEPNSSTYEGEWKDDLEHGMGTLTNENGVFSGHWLRGKRHGSGTMLYTHSIGDVATVLSSEGEWIHDNQSIGRDTFCDGSYYEGMFKNEEQHGQGKLVSPNGDCYEGDFVCGLFHGQGKMVNAATGRTYIGAWEHNKRHGFGSENSPTDGVYSGVWMNDLKQGRGMQVDLNGNAYDGMWLNGTLDGMGVFTWIDGAVYSGEWKEGLLHGRGHYKWASGEIYDGMWAKGVRHGFGVSVINGVRSEGQWWLGQRCV